MKGGFNNPPNLEQARTLRDELLASMKGGFNNPPNLTDEEKAELVEKMLQ